MEYCEKVELKRLKEDLSSSQITFSIVLMDFDKMIKIKDKILSIDNETQQVF